MCPMTMWFYFSIHTFTNCIMIIIVVIIVSNSNWHEISLLIYNFTSKIAMVVFGAKLFNIVDKS